MDQKPDHVIYVEDVDSVLSNNVKNAVGLDFGRVSRPLNAIRAYLMTTKWDASTESGRDAARRAQDIIRRPREAIGPDKRIIFTFWSGFARFTFASEPGTAASVLPAVRYRPQLSARL